MSTTTVKHSKWGKYLTILLFLASALGLLIGGTYLAYLGGSWYYLIMGVLFTLTTYGWAKDRLWALWLYILGAVATITWALWETGADFWNLAPRFDIWLVFGIWLLLPVSNRALSNTFGVTPAKFTLGAAIAAMIALLGYGTVNDPQEINGTITRQQPEQAQPTIGIAEEDWPIYGRTPAGTRYSPLKQINAKNASKLKEAWVYNIGDKRRPEDSGESTYEGTPIKIGNYLYLCTTHQMLDKIDARTGERVWRFDPQTPPTKTFQHQTCRGVSYYEPEYFAKMNPASAKAAAENIQAQLAANYTVKDENSTEETNAVAQASTVDKSAKIYLPTNDGRLFAINTETGKPVESFGENGYIDLKRKMPYAKPGRYNPTSPPVVTASTIIVGGSVADNFSNTEPSGVLRGYDVNTGKLLWIFDTGAANPNAIPGEDTTYVHNSPNAWAPLAYDAERDIVYVPTGVGTPDIWGGQRNELMERYANSILALNATTGKLIWHFQTTHHDLWDMDVPAQPSLADLKQEDGSVLPVVYVLTKTGNIFVFNRITGDHVVDIQEKAVPQTVKFGPQTYGERYSPTQPFSALNLGPSANEKLTDKNMWGGSMFDQMVCRILFKKLNYEGIYTPPSENGTLVFPGNLGVFEWGGISVNQDRQIALANPIGLPFVSRLTRTSEFREEVGSPGTEQGAQPMYGTPYEVDLHPFLSPLGLPCKEPSWGFITGVDLKTNEIVWKKRIGTIRDSLPKLFQLPPLKIGVPGLGGVISTAGDVMFVAATQDNYIRAFNTSNGEQLWQARLPAGGQATPMTYMIDGKQYVVILAGGHSSFGTKLGDTLIAYALDDAEIAKQAETNSNK